MGFHSPLIRPAISWRVKVALGGSGPLGSHDSKYPFTTVSKKLGFPPSILCWETLRYHAAQLSDHGPREIFLERWTKKRPLLRRWEMFFFNLLLPLPKFNTNFTPESHDGNGRRSGFLLGQTVTFQGLTLLLNFGRSTSLSSPKFASASASWIANALFTSKKWWVSSKTTSRKFTVLCNFLWLVNLPYSPLVSFNN